MRSTPAARRFTLGAWCSFRDHGMPSIELRSPRSPQAPASTQPNLPALVERYAELNDDDALVGLSGLSIADHPHSIEFEDRTLSSWCVWDPFFLVLALGGSAVIRSTDPQTGTTVRLTFEHGRVTEATPAGTIISIVVPPRRQFSGLDCRGTLVLLLKPGTAFRVSRSRRTVLQQQCRRCRIHHSGTSVRTRPSPPRPADRTGIANLACRRRIEAFSYVSKCLSLVFSF